MPRPKLFRRIRVPSDGNCFYHALRECLAIANVPAASLDTKALRMRVERRLRTKPTCAAQTAAVRRARTDGAWAESEEVLAAAEEFQLRIRVWEGANQMWITFGDGGERAPVVYMHNPLNVHFEPIVLVSQQRGACVPTSQLNDTPKASPRSRGADERTYRTHRRPCTQGTWHAGAPAPLHDAVESLARPGEACTQRRPR